LETLRQKPVFWPTLQEISTQHYDVSIQDDSQQWSERHNWLDSHLNIIGVIGAERLRVRNTPAVGSRLAGARAFGALALIPDRTAKHAFLWRHGDGWRHENGEDEEESSEINHRDALEDGLRCCRKFWLGLRNGSESWTR
jgi:hypothetical protein